MLAGRFRLGELLGTGGSASVFAAVDERTGLSVALKVLHPHLSERPAAREAFLAEARRAQPLRHPHIVGVLGVGVDRDADAPVAWIALERAPGSSLAQHVSRHGPLSPADAVVVIDGVLQALEAAHAIGLIHRDVSPSNVMVARDASGALAADAVRLLDFGLADAAGTAALGTDDLLSVEAKGRAGVMGNVNYMSPEQVRGMPIDERGDVYQAGALLHFTLTGRPPFPHETTGQTLRAHLETPPPLPSASNGNTPRSLDRLVVRAMFKDPGDRFASAAAMRAALNSVVERARHERDETSRVAARSSVVERARHERDETSPAAARSSVVERARDERDETSHTPDLPIPVPETVDALNATRVLGRTVVPPRREASVVVSSRPPRRVRSGAAGWLAAVGAVAVFAVVVVLAATSPPTESVARPTATPTPTPAAVVPEAQPQPPPDPVAPVVSLLEVPELAGLAIGDAMRALAGAGLAVGDVVHADSPYARDIVLEASPEAGHRVAAGAAVGLTVASGRNVVPDVAGHGREAAVAALTAAGFAVAFGRAPRRPTRHPGRSWGRHPERAPGRRSAAR